MTRTNHRRRSLLWKLTAFNIALLLLLYLGETYIAERNWLTTLVTYAPQHLLGVPALLLLVWSLVRRRWWIGAVNAAAAMFFAVNMLGFNIPLHARGRSGGPSVRVMTYNIHHASLGAWRIARDVGVARADVVCFQEVNRKDQGHDPLAELEKALPGWYHKSRGQLAVFSRFPITGWAVHEPAVEFWRIFLEVTVDARGRRLTIMDIHLNTAAGPGSLTDHYGSMASYLQGSTGARSSQISELLRIASEVRGPLIIAGDLNTPPRGRLYRRMTGSFRDCFQSAGWGLGYTYRSDLPIMRIDYIFTSKGLAPVRCKTLPLAGSDHRPVVADVEFTK